MSLKNVMVAQSGGPTVAINASLAGVIRGVMASDQYETVYGSVNGILGILNNHLLNLTEIMNENPAYLDRLETTPAMYLGSCRHKLPDYLDDDSSYVFIFKQFELYNVGAFFYIGGNDSMDTVLKLSEYGKKIGSSTLGFPTVNLHIPEGVIVPAFGVYTTKVCFGGESRIAVTNVGVRPTVQDGDRRVTVEGFILDFDGDLYGQTMRMEFYHRLRGERKFPSMEELAEEIRRNAQQAREYFQEKAEYQ